MILNALDEVLFWEDIETLKQFTKENSRQFYPHDYENYQKNAKKFFRTIIPSKAEFISRLETYADIGQPIWISGRNKLSDDIDAEAMMKAISVSSKVSNGEEKAARASKWRENSPSFWNFYTDNILHQQENKILELTVGAGGGTNAVMQKMTEQDYDKLIELSKKIEDYDRDTIDFLTPIFDGAKEFIYEDSCETNLGLVDYFIECGKYDMNDYLDPDLDLEDITVDELRDDLMDKIWNDEALYKKLLKDFIKENY